MNLTNTLGGLNGGGESVTDHSELTGLENASSHPISAIIGLRTELDSKLESADVNDDAGTY